MGFMRGFARRGWLGALAGGICLIFLLLPRASFAIKYCGDGIADCACGDIVNGNYTLTHDLGPCDNSGYKSALSSGNEATGFAYYGLMINSSGDHSNPTPITIDCNGHTIYTNTPHTSSYGITNAYVYDHTGCIALGEVPCSVGGPQCHTGKFEWYTTDCVKLCKNPDVYSTWRYCRSNVTIKNCTIKGFEYGINATTSKNWLIEDNVIGGQLSPAGVVAPTKIGIAGTFGDDIDSGSGILIRKNDILEVTQRGVSLWGLITAGSNEISGNRITAYATNGSAEAGVYLSRRNSTNGTHDSPVTIKDNFIDCGVRSSIGPGLSCAKGDLYFWSEIDSAAKKFVGVSVFNNVFSGKGVKMECTGSYATCATTQGISFAPSPDPNLTSQYNLFPSVKPLGTRGGGCTSSAPANTCDPDCTLAVDTDCAGLPELAPYDADEKLKACVEPPTTVTKEITENTCFNLHAETSPALTAFTPTKLADSPVPPAISFKADNVVLDCNWDNNVTLAVGKIVAGNADAQAGIGIEAKGVRLHEYDNGGAYISRKRGTIIGCRLESFGTGILLENSEDFLLRWNTVKSVTDVKQGFFYNIKSDHLQDCYKQWGLNPDDPDNDGDGFPCEPGIVGADNLKVDGDGISDVDPDFPYGARLLDFDHHIYNPAFRPSAGPSTGYTSSQNWTNDYNVSSRKQVLYLYGTSTKGFVLDGSDPWYGGSTYEKIGHLTVAGVPYGTIKNFDTAHANPFSAVDPLQLACVGMQEAAVLEESTCSQPMVFPVLIEPSLYLAVQAVDFTNQFAGVYTENSANLQITKTTAFGNKYGALMFRTSSTTIGCCTTPACDQACNSFNGNTEGIRSQGMAEKFLVWRNTIIQNDQAGLLLYDTNGATVDGNWIQDSGNGAGGSKDAVGLYLSGSQSGWFANNSITGSQGDNVELLDSQMREASTQKNYFISNQITDSVNGWGVYGDSVLGHTYSSTNLQTGGNLFGEYRGEYVCRPDIDEEYKPCQNVPAGQVGAIPYGLGGQYNNVIANNFAGGMQLLGSWDNILYKNNVYDNGRARGTREDLKPSGRGSNGIYLENGYAQNYVYTNRVYGNTGWGIHLQDAPHVYAYYNTIEDNASGGFLASAWLREVDYNTFIGNTMFDNKGPGMRIVGYENLWVIGNSIGIKHLDTGNPAGLEILNTVGAWVQHNTVTSTDVMLKNPYLRVAYDSSLRSYPHPAYSFPVDAYKYIRIGESNAAGQAKDQQTIEYILQDLSVVSQGGAYNNTYDVYLNQANPSTNYNSSNLSVKGGAGTEKRTLVRWGYQDILAYGSQPMFEIPGNCLVKNVKIAFNTFAGSASSKYSVRAVGQYWVDSEATWNLSCSSGYWPCGQWRTTPGDPGIYDLTDPDGSFSPQSFGQAVIYEKTLDADGRKVVQDWINGQRSNYGFVISVIDPADTAELQMRNEADAAAGYTYRHPALTVTCEMNPNVYFISQNYEYHPNGTWEQPMPADKRVIEKACGIDDLEAGKLCTQPSDCSRNGCYALKSYHVQLAVSDGFTVKDFPDLVYTINGADPLELDFTTNSTIQRAWFKNCNGPCVVLNNSGATVSDFEIWNPNGHGVVAENGADVVLKNFRIQPGAMCDKNSGAKFGDTCDPSTSYCAPGTCVAQVVEGDDIHLQNADVNISCDSHSGACDYPPRGPGYGIALPGKNDLLHNTSGNNQAWEFQASGLSTGAVSGTKFNNRGAFEVVCQPAKDGCCNAAEDGRCDRDCGIVDDTVTVDPDCNKGTVNPTGYCQSAGGDCCLPMVDGRCDPDCPNGVDPDCRVKGATGSSDCTVTGDGCEYWCGTAQGSSYIFDKDCRPTVSPAKDGYCYPAAEPDPGVCDPDCAYSSLAGGIVDADCEMGTGTNDGCWPVVGGSPACDSDCPAGVDSDCGVCNGADCQMTATAVGPGDACNAGSNCTQNASAPTRADGICNGAADTYCDPDCIGSGMYGSADVDCEAALCTARAAFEPGNRINSNGLCFLDPVTNQPPRDYFCDADCGPIGLGPQVDADCTAIDCCYPAVDGICDPDCPNGLDPDCIAPGQRPVVAGCQPWQDGACDYGCPPGKDPDCPPPTADTRNAVCDPSVNGICDQQCAAGLDPDCGVCSTTADGMCDLDCKDHSYNYQDPDCTATCTGRKDNCCLAVNDQQCDPDCATRTDGGPVDGEDCWSKLIGHICTNAVNDCCLPVSDSVCDADCPTGSDPDCSVDLSYCGNRSFAGANDFAFAAGTSLKLNTNYPYEKGVPNSAESCVAPYARFSANASGVPTSFTTQLQPLRSWTLEQRENARGKFKIKAQFGDFEGSNLSVGLMFARESPQPEWTDPIVRGWKGTYWAWNYFYSIARVGTYNHAQLPVQPGIGAYGSLPTATTTNAMGNPYGYPWCTQPCSWAQPSVDNPDDHIPGSDTLFPQIGVTTPVLARDWNNVTTLFTPNWNLGYVSTIDFYWDAYDSLGQSATYIRNQNIRTPFWLELFANDSVKCSGDLPCWSAGVRTSSVDLCSNPATNCAAYGGVCNFACAKDSTKPWYNNWTRRQRVMMDLQSPSFPDQSPSWGMPSAAIPISLCGNINIYSRTITFTPVESTDEETSSADPEIRSWTPYNTVSGNRYGAHYEIWYGTNADEVRNPLLYCSVSDNPCYVDGAVCPGTEGTCRRGGSLGDGDATNGPWAWEDIHRYRCTVSGQNCYGKALNAACGTGKCILASGLPHESCDWQTLYPTFDANLGQINCGSGTCTTVLYSRIQNGLLYNIIAVDDFGNESDPLFSESKPWLQTKFGDVFVGGSLNAQFQSGLNNATFLIKSGGTITKWTSDSTAFGGTGQLPGYTAMAFPSYKNDFTTPGGSLWFLQGYNDEAKKFYNSSNADDPGTVIGKLRQRYGSNKVINLGTICTDPNATTPPWVATDSVLNGAIYYYDGNCTISKPWTFNSGSASINRNGAGLFLIKGNLTFNAGTIYGMTTPAKPSHVASATWIALGGINIAPAVSQLDSSLIALGRPAYANMRCDSTGSLLVDCGAIDTLVGSSKLTVHGIMVARKYLFQRTYNNISDPAEQIIYDGRILTNPPPGLEAVIGALPVWE
ncbi:MAG: right-handed parallel beta-helix repeat-containing protein [Patescibacteria group bacterium]|nr:right-handed parallel beta-helix repeat-containing protein [Patescibacteria group bacterium]